MNMEKNVFMTQQPQIVFSGDNKVLVLLNEQQIAEQLGGGVEAGDPHAVERTAYQYDCYWLTLPTTAPHDATAVLAAAKTSMLAEITSYDASSSVNSFLLNGMEVWLDKATRVGLMNSTTIAKSMGQEKTNLWLGSYQLEVDCDKAIQLLSALEMYALECFNVTASHKKAVSELDNIEAILTYDYKSGYPEKLKMEV